jgi:hypothetical protein
MADEHVKAATRRIQLSKEAKLPAGPLAAVSNAGLIKAEPLRIRDRLDRSRSRLRAGIPDICSARQASEKLIGPSHTC